MIAVKVNPDNPAYLHVGRCEIRALVHSGAHGRASDVSMMQGRQFVLVKECHITGFHPYGEVLDCFLHYKSRRPGDQRAA